MFFRPTSNQRIPPDCKNIPPSYKGECLSDEEPTSEEYEDLDGSLQETLNTTGTQNRTALSGPSPCPNGSKRNGRKICKKIVYID